MKLTFFNINFKFSFFILVTNVTFFLLDVSMFLFFNIDISSHEFTLSAVNENGVLGVFFDFPEAKKRNRRRCFAFSF
jgi:hypothetical protein